MNALNQLLATLKVEANVFHNGQYCGAWALDTSGTKNMSFHVVSHGQCTLLVSDQKVILNVGDAVFFPSDLSHTITGVDQSDVPVNQAVSKPMTEVFEEDATGLVCGYFAHQHPIFDKLLAQLPDFIIVRSQPGSMSAQVIGLLLQESNTSGQTNNLLLNRLSDCLLYLLLREHVESSKGIFSALIHPKLSKSFDLIHGLMDQPLSVDELASAAGMSRSAFSALFKSVVGQSPIEYLTQWRMTEAYRWLADDRISTMAAALRSGYESEASFSKAFKRVMGFGPGQARRDIDAV